MSEQVVCETCGDTGEGQAPFAGYDKGVCPRCGGKTEDEQSLVDELRLIAVIREPRLPHTTAEWLAADEMEKLRVDLEGAKSYVRDATKDVKRLRKALEEIATRTTRELAAHSARIARATLDGKDWR